MKCKYNIRTSGELVLPCLQTIKRWSLSWIPIASIIYESTISGQWCSNGTQSSTDVCHQVLHGTRLSHSFETTASKVKVHQWFYSCLYPLVYIILKKSLPFLVSDVVMVPSLLLIFLCSCKIRSGSGLGTRLFTCNTALQEGIRMITPKQTK